MDVGLLIGGKYRLQKLIGSGGMGQVWIGLNEVTEREFALKLLLPQAASNPEIVARFVQEAKLSGRLRHPSILEIYDVGTAPELQGAPFLVMELLHGVPLEAAIRSLKGLPLRFTLHVCIAVARALGAAHDKRVVHRDLKPANVFLHRDDAGAVVPKLLDFGISKIVPTDTSPEETLGLTHTGALLGSPRFMSPEQIATLKDIDGRSDLHALGVLVWWCLVGRSPFTETSFHNLMLEILAEQRPHLLDAMPDAPVGVSEFVTRAMARKREDRYANATEALAVLEEELAKLGPGPSLTSRSWVDEVLAKVSSPPPAAPTSRPPRPSIHEEATTHGAVSVSIEPAVAAASVPPLALTANDSIARPATAPVSASAPPPRAPLRPGAWAAIGLAAFLCVGVAIAGVRSFGRSHASTAPSGDPIMAAAGAPSTQPPPAVSATASSVVSPPTPSASVAPPASTPAAVVVAPIPQRYPGARPGVKGATPQSKSTAGAAPTAADPFRGVTGAGL